MLELPCLTHTSALPFRPGMKIYIIRELTSEKLVSHYFSFDVPFLSKLIRFQYFISQIFCKLEGKQYTYHGNRFKRSPPFQKNDKSIVDNFEKLYRNKDENKQAVEFTHMLSRGRPIEMKEMVPGQPSEYMKKRMGSPGFYDS